ncbi:MAG: peptidoglycan-binding domain-containing protein [Candidatus Sulfotelmatobacter sp.]|jgi:peptidoglycan hydrolase-like protein with peptidoglycan-binding domain
MLYAGKVGCVGVVFLLLTTWISGPRTTPLLSRQNLSREESADKNRNDGRDGNDAKALNAVEQVQQTLQNQGHYRGKIDGALGLRTRASIREFQRAENLPVTGQLDLQTAGKLGVTPEVRTETSSETTKDKPSAGIKWTKDSKRPSRARRSAVKTLAAPEGGGDEKADATSGAR